MSSRTETETLGLSSAAPCRGSTVERPPPASIPSCALLGRYQLLEVLGQGGMATVFRARDSRLGRQVAIKVLHAAAVGQAHAEQRFQREAVAAAALKHWNILQVFDFIPAVGAEPSYLVSELIIGITLRRFLDQRRGRLFPESAALVAWQLADALQAVHTAGVVHRDVKPDNVMLEAGPRAGRVVLTDFGVAQMAGLRPMNVPGALVGSPAYMSPEQARGAQVEATSDQWALGLLLYEMATGRLPPHRQAWMAPRPDPARTRFARPSQLSPYVDREFDDICMPCLEFLPERRHSSIAVVGQRLRAYCEAAGLTPGPAEVGRLLSDPEQFQQDLRPLVAGRALALARAHLRRGATARALAEISRAMTYVPDDAAAPSLLARVTR